MKINSQFDWILIGWRGGHDGQCERAPSLLPFEGVLDRVQTPEWFLSQLRAIADFKSYPPYCTHPI